PCLSIVPCAAPRDAPTRALHDALPICVQRRVIARVARNPRRHEQDGGAHALAAARLDVLADGRDELHLRLHVPPELTIDLLEVVDRKSTRLNSSHEWISYAVFCLKKKK